MWRYRSESHGEGRVVQEVKWGLLDKSIERCTRREKTVLEKSLLKSRNPSSAAFRQWEEFHSWRLLQVQTLDQCRRRPCEERTAMGVMKQTARAEGCHRWRQNVYERSKECRWWILLQVKKQDCHRRGEDCRTWRLKQGTGRFCGDWHLVQVNRRLG